LDRPVANDVAWPSQTGHPPRVAMITWIIEREVFADGDGRLIEVARSRGHRIMYWQEAWRLQDDYTPLTDAVVVFHGSLNIAALIKDKTPWTPGVYCNLNAFEFAHWSAMCADVVVNKQWLLTTVRDLVESPEVIFATLGVEDRLFVRPNSALKPFSGRVVERKHLSYRVLDCGLYYDDIYLEVIVAPVVPLGREWRFVVAKDRVVAGSGYTLGRFSQGTLFSGREWDFAQTIAERIIPPDDLYVLDVGESMGSMALVELNPFSGADLYDCHREDVVHAVEQIVARDD
ncbi:MAG: ATP-grasp domain-containing protein, partial [Candidatus Competibacterales bacterium]